MNLVRATSRGQYLPRKQPSVNYRMLSVNLKLRSPQKLQLQRLMLPMLPLPMPLEKLPELNPWIPSVMRVWERVLQMLFLQMLLVNPWPERVKAPEKAKAPEKVKALEKAKEPERVKAPEKVKEPEKVLRVLGLRVLGLRVLGLRPLE